MFGASLSTGGASVFGGGGDSDDGARSTAAGGQAAAAPAFGAGAFSRAAADDDGDAAEDAADSTPPPSLQPTADKEPAIVPWSKGGAMRLRRTPEELPSAVKRRISSATSPGSSAAAAASKSLLNRAIALKTGAAARKATATMGRIRPVPQQQQQQQPASAAARQTARVAPGTLRDPFDTAAGAKPTPAAARVVAAEWPRGRVVAELRALYGTLCPGANERWTVLDQRDKILRKGRARPVDLKNAAVVVGTCPDMCPEKERYLRTVGKQLRRYEQTAQGLCDHAACVKEYARSSADKEEPLAHELRHLPVLRRTMTHLMVAVGGAEPDAADGNALCSWFDFLWNRTRAIRMEITQQMLAGPEATEMVEQCFAFHLFAGYHLCECPNYDPTINNENRGKSMQSLRHMYEDLARKGHQCENEAKFRALDALFNVDDANTLPALLRHGSRIRESAECRLAVKFIAAYHTNNYVRFFRLLRQCDDFLVACALHRHMDPFRSTALRTIVHSCGVSLQCDLRFISRTLAFDDDDRCADFVAKHGLRIDGEAGERTVRLTKQTFRRPAIALRRGLTDLERTVVMSRCALVDAKRPGDRTLAAIVRCAAGVHVAPPPPPVDSFDEDGRYVNDPIANDYVDSAGGDGGVESDASMSMSEAAEPQRAEPDDGRRRALTVAVATAQRRLCDSLLYDVARLPVVLAYGGAVCDRLCAATVGEAVGRLLDNIAPRLYSAALAAKRRADRLAALQRRVQHCTESCAGALVDRVAGEVADTLLRDEYRRQALGLRKKELLQRAAAVYDGFYECFIDWYIRRTCQEVFAERVTLPLRAVERMARRARLRQAAECLAAWRQLATDRRRTWRHLQSFPSGCVAVDAGLRLRAPDNLLGGPWTHDGVERLKAQLDEHWYSAAVRQAGKRAADALLSLRRRRERDLLQTHFDAWLYTSRLCAARRRSLAAFGLNVEYDVRPPGCEGGRRRPADYGAPGHDVTTKRRRVSVADLKAAVEAGRTKGAENGNGDPSTPAAADASAQSGGRLSSASGGGQHTGHASMLSEGIVEHRSWGVVRTLQHSVGNRLAAFKARLAADTQFWDAIVG